MQSKTKKGNNYNIRDNKLASGFSKMSADRQLKDDRFINKQSKYNSVFLDLIVFGTCDQLAHKFMYTEYIIKHCPTDSSYTKKVKVLGKKGKRLLKQLRLKRGG